jgi:2-dehydropantoate 2-reductase
MSDAFPALGTPDDPVVVWGAGAMGGSIGAALAHAGRQVVFVDADEPHVRAINEKGLRVTGPLGELSVQAPAYLPDQLDLSPRTVLLCVKAHQTEAALDILAPLLAHDGFVVSVQNGLNERVIARRVGEARTVGCLVNFGADLLEPGLILRGNRGAVVVGELDGASGERVRAVHELFRLFEPDALLTANIWGYLWGKLAYGAILFATALTDATIAEVLASPDHRPALVGLAREVVRVARARGVRPEGFDGFDPGAFAPDAEPEDALRSLDELVVFNRASAKARTGVWRDIAVRRRKTEVDAQIAVVAELGSEAGVETPLVRRLVELVHDVEEGRRPQSWETLDLLGDEPPKAAIQPAR